MICCCLVTVVIFPLALRIWLTCAVCVNVLQHYIELSSHYQRPCPPVNCSVDDDQLCGPSAGSCRPACPASVHVARQQSMESGVFMSRQASSDLDTSPRRASSASRSSSDAATHLLLSPRRSQSSTDEGYLLPTPTATCQQLLASHRDSASATSDSNLCGSMESDVFEHGTLV